VHRRRGLTLDIQSHIARAAIRRAPFWRTARCKCRCFLERTHLIKRDILSLVGTRSLPNFQEYLKIQETDNDPRATL
jgi:hypothetical protein